MKEVDFTKESLAARRVKNRLKASSGNSKAVAVTQRRGEVRKQALLLKKEEKSRSPK